MTIKKITPQSIKNIEKLLQKDVLVFITASWCHYCSIFSPEKDLFIKNNKKINIIDINDTALMELKKENSDIYKKIVPSDGKVFFPMILHLYHKNGKLYKKLYTGERTSHEINKYLKG